MNTTNFEMELLNPEEMKEVIGGKACTKTGDTLACAPLIGKVVTCATYELSCPSGFTYCGSLKDSMTCGNGFVIKPKPVETLPPIIKDPIIVKPIEGFE